jgi:predicted histidine transporter YuiF (NhaC family)
MNTGFGFFNKYLFLPVGFDRMSFERTKSEIEHPTFEIKK